MDRPAAGGDGVMSHLDDVAGDSMRGPPAMTDVYAAAFGHLKRTLIAGVDDLDHVRAQFFRQTQAVRHGGRIPSGFDLGAASVNHGQERMPHSAHLEATWPMSRSMSRSDSSPRFRCTDTSAPSLIPSSDRADQDLGVGEGGQRGAGRKGE